MLQETMHELHKKTGQVELSAANLRKKGFSYTWCQWISQLSQGGNVGIKVNDQLEDYFQTSERGSSTFDRRWLRPTFCRLYRITSLLQYYHTIMLKTLIDGSHHKKYKSHQAVREADVLA